MPNSVFIHKSAVVDQPSSIGNGTKIWHFSHVMKNSKIGENCIVGQGVFVDSEVVIGNRCKIQNGVSIYTGVTLEDGVFCGPSMVFTNVLTPRAEIERKHEFTSTLVKKGASLGANVTVVCGTTIGRYAMVGAASVVTRDIPDYALVTGNPGSINGSVCQCGKKLNAGDWNKVTCAACNSSYTRDDYGIIIRDE
ncbi:MAG: N-acetyltransferase [Rhodospirillales bacterium]|nr:N-acetyltransferase [Rhodospirillales bacterium]